MSKCTVNGLHGDQVIIGHKPCNLILDNLLGEFNVLKHLSCQIWKITSGFVFFFFPSQESENLKLVEKRAILDSKTPEKMKHSQSIFEDGQLPIEQKKRKIQRNLRTLEQAGLVSSATKYQEIINEIAKVNRVFACTYTDLFLASSLNPLQLEK